MTKTEFERRYAEKSGMTVEKMHELGLRGIPCACGDGMCLGWLMTSKENEAMNRDQYGPREDEQEGEELCE